MFDDRDGCEWVNVSSVTGLLGQGTIKRLCVYAMELEVVSEA